MVPPGSWYLGFFFLMLIFFVLFRRVVFHALKNGYRVAVLNHIGTLCKSGGGGGVFQIRFFLSAF